MSHVIIPNVPSISTDDFIAIWKLTRGMLAAGWKYRSSGDATTATKDVSGVSGQQETAFASDKWGVGGGVQLNTTVQSGTSPNITAGTDGTATVTFSGSTFTANSVGRFLTIAGCNNAGNNGTFRITTFTSATSIKIFTGGSAVTENTASATWSEKHGAANGTISTAGTGGAILQRAIFTVSSGTPFVAPTTSPINRGSVGDRLTIIGGAVSANNGTWMITRVISSTSVEIANSAANATGETNNGSLSWVECSPTAQVYPTSITASTGVGAWWNAQGPSMMKIPIGTNTVTGAFQRGELVTQTTSGATGAIVGVVADTSGGLGFLVIEPRINGTGSGPRGWTSGLTDTVSAQSAPTGSGATVGSSTGAPIEFVNELVFWKSSNQNGHWWNQCVDQSGESASRFSQIASSNGGVTNTIAPGGASASFPTPGSWVNGGTANSNAAATGALDWFQESNSTTVGNVHVMCANCIETATTSQDGSFTVVVGVPATSPTAYVGIGFWRCDDSEDGDVNPYVCVTPGNSGDNYLGTRTVMTANANSTNYFLLSAFLGNGSTVYRGWRKRGFASGDAFQEFQACVLNGAIGGALLQASAATPGHVVNNPSSTPIFIREAIWIISNQLTQKMRKGTLRWLFGSEGIVGNQSYNNGAFIALASPSNSSNDALVAGPWDGQSTASNS